MLGSASSDGNECQLTVTVQYDSRYWQAENIFGFHTTLIDVLNFASIKSDVFRMQMCMHFV